MTSEEKLKHFEESAIGRANELSEEMLSEYQASLNKNSREYQDSKNQQALLKVKTEIQNLKRESNISLSREQMNIKRNYIQKMEELTGQLFAEVRDKVENYKKTPEYAQLLERQIREIQKIAGEKEYEICLSPSDGDKCEALRQKTGANLKLSGEAFLGGTRGMLDHQRILVDYSFDSRMRELQDNFTFEGGMSHE
ncbi:MAG: Archaeal/vacuolar-type H+-ATPase subunit E [Lachnospiraceae bacterium]|nr:Archaeal/vacuolar-type H+-ATPase subunit E [Lachnospiraceae bacterium]MDD3794427.1 Archaeal/vacuolar-type H+-ATPase subunit E [Lachnospiraceae bacterium]